MIGKLSGIIAMLDESYIILDVSGVGYIVYCTSSILSESVIGEPLTLWISMQVNDGEATLFGFKKIVEKKWFEALVSVHGVGKKIALSILSILSIDELSIAIATEDKDIFRRVGGIGNKLTMRIINELKTQLKHIASGTLLMPTDITNVTTIIENDAESALVNLGFKKSVVQHIVHELYLSNPYLSLEELIKFALFKLTSKCE